MKKPIALVIALLITISSFAQQGINYKAVIKDGSGNVLANQSISVKFTISIGVGFETVYEEEHVAVDTDSNGIIILDIGEGNIISGDFSVIDWNAWDGHTNLQTDIDITGGTSYIYAGVSQFKTVPYAKLANSVKNQAFKIENNVIIPIDTNDDFIVGSTQLDNDDIVFGTKRLFFDKFQGAFRAGYTISDAWDNANRGQNSFATGSNTEASGSNSVAMGSLTEATAQTSMAFGEGSKATGLNSTAMGNNSQAAGINSTAIGNNTIASGSSSIAIGKYNADDSNALFMVGNGTTNTNRNNALTIYNNGNSSLNGDATINGDLGVTGDILMNFNSEVQNPNTGFANLVPIAYGSVSGNATPTVLGGTGNFTVSRNTSTNEYTISVAGKTLTASNTVTSVVANTTTYRTVNATYSGGDLIVHIFASDFQKVISPFQFTIYQE